MSNFTAAKPRLCYIVTTDDSVSLLRGQLNHMRYVGFDVTLVTSGGPRLDAFRESEGVRCVTVPMSREISPFTDTGSLWKLTRFLRQLRPHLVNAATPKAGLLGMLAAKAAGVPARVYHVMGLRLETLSGWKRQLLLHTEKQACHAAHRVLCVSPSLRRVCRRERIAPTSKTDLVGAGTTNGIDVDRFAVAGSMSAQAGRERARAEWGISDEAFVYGVVGRVTRDKGIEDLYRAFTAVADRMPSARLLVVGAVESGDPISSNCLARLRSDRRVVMTGYQDNPSDLYSAMDVLVHPSLREGFGNAAAEGSAAGLPVVGRRITGVVDAIEHGHTGTVVDPAGFQPLVTAMLEYSHNRDLARRHGSAGRARVERLFRPELVWSNLTGYYRDLLAQRGLPLPQEKTSSLAA